MKRLSLLFVICGIWFSACQNDSTSPDPATEAADIETLVASAARLAVSTDSVTVKTCKGKLTEVATADLATAVTDYITATYPGSTIKYAARDASGQVVVAVTLADGTVKGLIFNADGTFKAELLQHSHKAELTKIDSTALPAAVTTYITSTYSGASISAAATNAEGEYYVAIKTADAVKVLLFNADGTFSKELDKPAKRHKKH